VFNQANQETGEQRQALAASVVAFAGWLVGNDDAPFQPVVERIAHKHASLAVRPEVRSSATRSRRRWPPRGRRSTGSPP
jgi:hemoglobin-like flavoprotein